MIFGRRDSLGLFGLGQLRMRQLGMRVRVVVCMAGLLALPGVRQSVIAPESSRVEREQTAVAVAASLPAHTVEAGRGRATSAQARWTSPRHPSLGLPAAPVWPSAAHAQSRAATGPHDRGCPVSLVCGYRATAPPART